jgi:hypothetical protein
MVMMRYFLFVTASRQALRPTQLLTQWTPRALTSGVKRPERETDHSPLFSAEVKNASSFTPFPHYAFMVWCFIKHRYVLNALCLVKHRDVTSFLHELSLLIFQYLIYPLNFTVECLPFTLRIVGVGCFPQKLLSSESVRASLNNLPTQSPLCINPHSEVKVVRIFIKQLPNFSVEVVLLDKLINAQLVKKSPYLMQS